eukprot:g46526.t1
MIKRHAASFLRTEIETAEIKSLWDDYEPPKEKHHKRLLDESFRPSVLEELCQKCVATEKWNILWKLLIILHSIMNEGHINALKSLLQYWNGSELTDFQDGSSEEAIAASSFIRVYFTYLNTKMKNLRELGRIHVRSPVRMDTAWPRALSMPNLVSALQLYIFQMEKVVELPVLTTGLCEKLARKALHYAQKDAVRLYALLCNIVLCISAKKDEFQDRLLLLNLITRFRGATIALAKWITELKEANGLEVKEPEYDVVPPTMEKTIREGMRARRHSLSFPEEAEKVPYINQSSTSADHSKPGGDGLTRHRSSSITNFPNLTTDELPDASGTPASRTRPFSDSLPRASGSDALGDSTTRVRRPSSGKLPVDRSAALDLFDSMRTPSFSQHNTPKEDHAFAFFSEQKPFKPVCLSTEIIPEMTAETPVSPDGKQHFPSSPVSLLSSNNNITMSPPPQPTSLSILQQTTPTAFRIHHKTSGLSGQVAGSMSVPATPSAAAASPMLGASAPAARSRSQTSASSGGRTKKNKNAVQPVSRLGEGSMSMSLALLQMGDAGLPPRGICQKKDCDGCGGFEGEASTLQATCVFCHHAYGYHEKIFENDPRQKEKAAGPSKKKDAAYLVSPGGAVNSMPFSAPVSPARFAHTDPVSVNPDEFDSLFS